MGILDKKRKNYRETPSCLDGGADGMPMAIIPAGIYELYAPSTHFLCPEVLIGSSVILSGTTEQQEHQIRVD